MMEKNFLASAVCMLLFSGFAVAAETAAEGAAAGAEGASKGLALNDGAVLIALGVVASIAVLAVLYFLLSKRKA